ncbi:hypothetical protein HY641_00430, partial [Candidatus Woesearchaeota archaeon]|nr:hypothetical protein [Candidatus Woesearchaeota archaeon]
QGVGNSQAEETRLTQQDSLLAAEWLGPDEQEEASFLYALSRVIERPGFFEALELQLALPPRWDDPRVRELAKDISRGGVTKPLFTLASGEKIYSSHWAPNMLERKPTSLLSRWPLDVFEHKPTHLRIVRKHKFIDNHSDIESFLPIMLEGYIPTFLSQEEEFYYELELRPFGYYPIEESHFGIREFFPSMKVILTRLHEAGFIHGHPQNLKNWLVSPRGQVILLDSKLLQRASEANIAMEQYIFQNLHGKDADHEASSPFNGSFRNPPILNAIGTVLLGSFLVAIAWVISPILGFFALVAAMAGIVLLFQGPGPLRGLIRSSRKWLHKFYQRFLDQVEYWSTSDSDKELIRKMHASVAALSQDELVAGLLQRQVKDILIVMVQTEALPAILAVIEDVVGEQGPQSLGSLGRDPSFHAAIADAVGKILNTYLEKAEFRLAKADILRTGDPGKQGQGKERLMDLWNLPREHLIQGIRVLRLLHAPADASRLIQSLEDVSLSLSALETVQAVPGAFHDQVLTILRTDDSLKRWFNLVASSEPAFDSVDAVKVLVLLGSISSLEPIARESRVIEARLQALSSLIELQDEAALERLAADETLVRGFLSDEWMYRDHLNKLLDVFDYWLENDAILWALADVRIVTALLARYARASISSSLSARWKVIGGLQDLLSERFVASSPSVKAVIFEMLSRGGARGIMLDLALTSTDPQVVVLALEHMDIAEVSWPSRTSLGNVGTTLAQILTAAHKARFEPLLTPLFEALFVRDVVDAEALTVMAAVMGLSPFGKNTQVFLLQPYLEDWVDSRVTFATAPSFSKKMAVDAWGRRSFAIPAKDGMVVFKQRWEHEIANQELVRAALASSLLAAAGVEPQTLPILLDAGNDAYAYHTLDPEPRRRLTDDDLDDIHERLRQAAKELALLVGIGGSLTINPTTHANRWLDEDQLLPTDSMLWMNSIASNQSDASLFSPDDPKEMEASAYAEESGNLSQPADLVRYVNLDTKGHVVDRSDARWGQGPWQPTSVARRVGQAAFEFTLVVLRAIAR